MPSTGNDYKGVAPGYTTAKAGPVRNAGITVLYGGNIVSGGPVTQAPGLTTVGFHSGSHGSLTPGPFGFQKGIQNHCVTFAISGRRYAGMAAGKYVMMRNTPEVAGTVSTLLNSGAGNFGRLPYPNRMSNRIRTTRVVTTGGWNYQTGQAIAATDFADTLNPEAFPTRPIPGRITYLQNGSKVATTANYSARND